MITYEGDAPYYFVIFQQPSVASYRGGIANIAPPSRNAADNGRLITRSGSAPQYVSYLRQQQDQFLGEINQRFGRQVEVLKQFQYALNAVAIKVSAAEAASLENMDGVKFVRAAELALLDTDRGPAFIGAPGLWDGSNASGSTGSRGEGLVFGDLDSGINFLSPSFAATGGDGHVHVNPLGAGTFLGTCATGGVDAGQCNNKLIGAYDFVFSVTCPGGVCGDDLDEASATDNNGHGTHTASTVAGNVTTATIAGTTRPVSGVAPHANLIAYDVCFTRQSTGQGLCPTVSSASAVEQAIEDGIVDVINFSIGGGTAPWSDPVSLAFLSAVDAGIFVSTSAGNSGPGPSTLGHLEPWTATTAASTHDRLFADAVFNVTGPTPVPAPLTGVPGVINADDGTVLTTTVTGPLRMSTNALACTAGGGFTGGPFPANFIAVIQRGSCNFSEKVINATTAGAAGVVIYNNTGAAPIIMSVPGTTRPAIMIPLAAGNDLAAYITANPTTATGSMAVSTPPSFSLVTSYGDIMASFSSRGPNTFNTLKPDITGPGVAILAAFAGPADSYEFLQGTSMSSPHNAGSALLLKAIRPTWSIPEIKSALMISAKGGVLKENGTTPSDPFDRGAGRLDLTRAANVPFVLNETVADYQAANPTTGGQPNALNTPSYQNLACGGSCTFTRTIRSVSTSSQTYTAAVVAPVGGVTGTVTPASFTLAPGAEQELTVTVDVTGQTIGTFRFAELQITNTSAGILSFSNNTSTVIPDDLYTGGFGGATMACTDIDTSTLPAGTNVSNASIVAGITHTWVGDLIVKLRAPNGNILGVMSRPGFDETTDDGDTETGNGDSSNISASFPVTFEDGAATSAETMGTTLPGSNDVVCQTAAPCNFSPAPDSVAVPPANFAALDGTNAVGTWTLCVGDRAGSDTGNLVNWTLKLAGGGGGPQVYNMPIAVRPSVPLTPAEVNVTPTSITRTLAPGGTSTDTITIQNTGQTALNWTITETAPNVLLNVTEVPSEKYAANIRPRPEVIRSRGQAVTTRSYFESRFSDAPAGGIVTLQVDDGTNEDSIGLTGGGQFVFFNRFTPTPDTFPFQLSDVQVFFDPTTGVDVGELFDVFIYSDADSNPQTGATLVTQQLNVAVTATGVFQNVTLSTPAALSGPGGDVLVAIVPRTAGTGASEFPAAIDTTATQTRSWVASYGGPVPTPPVFPAPSPGLFGTIDSFGLPGNWLLRATGVAALGDCGTPEDAPWLTASPTSGSTNGGASSTVTVSINAAGLTPGSYSATVCVSSNDADEANVPVNVSLTVNNPVDAMFQDGFESP